VAGTRPGGAAQARGGSKSAQQSLLTVVVARLFACLLFQGCQVSDCLSDDLNHFPRPALCIHVYAPTNKSSSSLTTPPIISPILLPSLPHPVPFTPSIVINQHCHCHHRMSAPSAYYPSVADFVHSHGGRHVIVSPPSIVSKRCCVALSSFFRGCFFLVDNDGAVLLVVDCCGEVF